MRSSHPADTNIEWSLHLNDPVRFTSLDMLMHAKVATVLALAAWLVPLACIPSTGSLSLATQSISYDSFGGSVQRIGDAR
jgi:hypothetical protein